MYGNFGWSCRLVVAYAWMWIIGKMSRKNFAIYGRACVDSTKAALGGSLQNLSFDGVDRTGRGVEIISD